jgi:hypothetical protein
VRKDTEKDVERPRYYSQFWLDVAAGRRVIGTGKGTLETDDGELAEQETAPESVIKATPVAPRGTPPPPAPAAEPPGRLTAPAAHQPIHLSGRESLDELAAAIGMEDIGEDEEVPELTGSRASAGSQVVEPEVVEPVEAEEQPADSQNFADLYEEEEEEEEGWSPRRGGKKPKKPEKPRRREKGRDY